MSSDPEDFDDTDSSVDWTDSPRCESCGVDLDVDPCICGPAGPRVNGLWTGENGKGKEPSLAPFRPSLEKCVGLINALREKSRQMVERHEGSNAEVSDAAELLNVLARMVEGKTVYQAFGAPGDWGYGTPIGDALRTAYSGSNR